MKRISYKQVKKLLHYNQHTGTLIHALGVNKGSVAGWLTSQGEIKVKVCNHVYKAQDLIWLYQISEWPLVPIKHRDKNKANNKWENLREATDDEILESIDQLKIKQAKNQIALKNGSKYNGKGKYSAYIRGQHIGTYDCKNKATRAYNLAAVLQLGEKARISKIRNSFSFPKKS